MNSKRQQITDILKKDQNKIHHFDKMTIDDDDIDIIHDLYVNGKESDTINLSANSLLYYAIYFHRIVRDETKAEMYYKLAEEKGSPFVPRNLVDLYPLTGYDELSQKSFDLIFFGIDIGNLEYVDLLFKLSNENDDLFFRARGHYLDTYQEKAKNGRKIDVLTFALLAEANHKLSFDELEPFYLQFVTDEKYLKYIAAFYARNCKYKKAIEYFAKLNKKMDILEIYIDFWEYTHIRAKSYIKILLNKLDDSQNQLKQLQQKYDEIMYHPDIGMNHIKNHFEKLYENN